MITCICGFPGSGKSLLLGLFAYMAVNDKPLRFRNNDFTHFEQYDRVYTNFNFKGAYQLDFEELGYSDYKNSLILCDEIQLFADSRNFRNFGENLKLFFSEHRKQKIDFVYATQDMSFVDVRIRSLTQRVFYIDRSNFGFMRVRRIDPAFDVSQMKSIFQFCPTIDNMYFYMKRLYHLVDTNEMIGSMVCRSAPLKLWGDFIYHFDFYSFLDNFDFMLFPSFVNV